MSDNTGVTGSTNLRMQEASRPELNDLKLVIVEALGNFPIELTRVSETVWKQLNDDPVPVLSTGLVLVATSERHGDVSSGHIEEDLIESLKGQENTEWNLELRGENSLVLLISFKLCHPTWDLTEAESLDELEEQVFANPMMALRLFQLLQDDHPNKANGLNMIGDKLQEKFDITQDRADIDASIIAYEQALKLLPPEDVSLISFLHDTGLAYDKRFSRLGDIADINNAIYKWEGVLAMLLKSEPDLPAILNNLGCLFRKQFEQAGSLDDIVESIKLQQRAVELTPERHADLPSRLNSLGISFMCQFERTGDVDDIAQSIQLKQRAVDLTPDGHKDLPSRLNNLGNSFHSRFEQTGNLDDLAESIQL
ncbi:hypothetical protein CVT26_012821, partial [Gymnopilus dilepis]